MLISSKNRLLHMQITADSNGVYTKVFSLSPYQNFDVIRQWSVQWCLMSGPSCLIVLGLKTGYRSDIFGIKRLDGWLRVQNTKHMIVTAVCKLYVYSFGYRV